MRHLVAALLVASTPLAVVAQQPQTQQPQTQQASGPVLTLEEAIQLGIRNNPQHLQRISARTRSGADLRAAYGQWLPQVSTSLGGSFREGGTTVFQGQQFGAASDVVSSSYGINVSASFSGSTLLQPKVARANLDASEAEVRQSEAETRAAVIREYVNVLRAQARAALQDTLLINVQAQLELNRARQAVGAATVLEVRRSEVAVGQAQVNVLRERNSIETALLTLFQQVGIEKPEGVRLVTTFPVTEPTLQLQELLDMARRANPALNAARSRENAANVSVAAARSQWLPRVSFNTGWSGYTRSLTSVDGEVQSAQFGALASRRSCMTQDSIRTGAGLAALGNCDRFTFTPADEAAIRAENDQFPFAFNKDPFGYSVSLSLPIFDGFRREQQIQNASLARNDARYALRAQELQMNTQVTSAYLNLNMQYQTVRLEEINRQAAEEALRLAEERYRVGANTFLDVTQARSEFETAGNRLINAIYDFHTAYAELERAVGRSLR